MEHAPALWHSNTRLLCEAHLSHVAGELGLDALPEGLCESGPRTWLPFPDSLPALLLLHALGCRCGLITNWDYTARDVVAKLGLERLLSPIVVSAEAGCEKPERRVFELALDAAGVGAHEAVYVGDNYWADVLGAQDAGLSAVLVDRHPQWSGRRWPCETIADLWGVVRVVTRRTEVAAQIS